MLDNGNARERETIDSSIDDRKLSISTIPGPLLLGVEVNADMDFIAVITDEI